MGAVAARRLVNPQQDAIALRRRLRAQRTKGVTTVTTDFHGLPTRRIRSTHLQLDFLAQAGPRLVRLFVDGHAGNLLAEVPGVNWPTPYGEFRIYGGHRLWHAPEAFPRTNVPDNEGLTVEDLPDGVRLTQPVEAPTGIGKCMEVRLHPDRPALTITHHLTNEGIWPVECAPWAITQLPPGGLAILPQQVGPLDAHNLLPNRHLVLWPYARWSDARLMLGDDVIAVRAQPQLPPLKIGYLNRGGWIAYLRDGVLFVKRFEPRLDRPHVDFDANAEVYCNDVFIELETLGPLRRLDPGQRATHIETWEIHTGIDAPATLDGARAVINLLNGKGQ
jgi:hypothetical protein